MKTINLPGAIGLVEKNSLAYIELAFDALLAGRVVVPVKAAQNDPRLQCVAVENVITPEEGGGWFERPLSLSDSGDVAHVSFTSGTEGPPKGVMISRTALNDTVRRLQSLMHMDDSVREYIGVPVYHSFGYGRCRHVASVGGSFYIPPRGFNPVELSELLQSGKVNALSLVPSLLRVLIAQPSLLGAHSHALKWLEIGSQAMSVDEKLAVKALFPNATIIQHYGLTEASRTTLLKIHPGGEAALDSVGQVFGDGNIRINDKGCICIQGSHLASEIIKEGDRFPVTNASGWLETTDLGQIDNGHLYFLGRADNVVNCGGQKLSTEKLEATMHQYMSDNHEFAISRILDNTYGEAFLLSYTDESAHSVLVEMAKCALDELGINAKSAVHFNWCKTIPKTHTGKVQHKVLIDEFSHQQKDETDVDTDKSLLSLFSKILNIQPDQLDMSDTISRIGVDSLQTIQLSIQLEAMLGYLPAQWRELSLQQLSELSRQSPKKEQVRLQTQPSSGKAKPLWDGSSNMNPSGIGFWSLLKEDFLTHDRDIFSQGLFAMFVHRFGNWRMSIKYKLFRFPMTLLYRVLRKGVQIFCGIKLDYTVHVGRRVKLEHFGGMIIGARCIGDDTIIRQNVTMGIRDMSDLSAKPTIEQGVNIGAGAVIVGDITVGRHSIIGPNCVITEDVPPFSVVSVGTQTVQSLQESS